MFKKLKKDPIFIHVAGEKNKNILNLCLTIIPSVVAGLMEGISYLSLLIALNILKGDPGSSMPIFTILIKLVKNFSQNQQFFIFIIFGLFIQIIRSSLIFLSQYIVSRISIKITTEMQCKIYNQIFSFTYPFVSKYQAGFLISYNQAPSVIPNLLLQINAAFSSLALGLISLLWLIKINLSLTVILLLVFFAVNYFYKLIFKKVSLLSIDLTDNEIKFSSKNNENINGIKLIHMFYKQEYIVSKTKEILKKIATTNSTITFWKTLITSFGEIIGIVVVAIMLVIGAILLHHKNSFVSYLLMFIFIAYRLSSRLQLFMNSFADILAMKGSILRLREILSDKNKEFLPKSGKDIEKFSKMIKFENLSFLYSTRKVSALENFSFEFEKGKTYAIVGKSGSGKSTLIDLLINLYQPTSGSIVVDGVNLNEISLKSWRSKIGIVNQDIFLFHDTILDNIKFGNELATLKKIKLASKLAYADDFIDKLPDKYETIVGEKGHKLSGGERQRIALARALVKNPDILILDEATSHLDSYSEKLIQNAIDNLRQEKTVIIIAHRLSTIVNADNILVMSEGKLVEAGTHDELIQKQGLYTNFWNIQSKPSNKKEEENQLAFDTELS